MAALGTAGTAAAIDGPFPAGDAFGVAVLGGSCIYRIYRSIRAAQSAAAALEAMGSFSEGFDDRIFDHIKIKPGGRIDGDVDVESLPEELLGEAEELLDQSIGVREQDQSGRPRGNPNGDYRQRHDNRNWRGHQERLRREREWLRRVRERNERTRRDTE